MTNHFLDETFTIMGNLVFKVGNKIITIEKIDGLEFSSNEYYNSLFSQPSAIFFILEKLENDQVKMVLSGTLIRANNYKNFDDIKSDYINDTTLTILSAVSVN